MKPLESRILAFFLVSLILSACTGTAPTELLKLVATSTPPPVPTATAEPPASPEPAIPDSTTGFLALVSELEASRLADRQALVNQYMISIEQAPVVDEKQAIFIWQGAARSVHLHGDMNNWITDQSLPFTHIDETDLWYVVLPAETAARLDYVLIIDAARITLDRLNPRQITTQHGVRSVLQMPAYERPAELDGVGLSEAEKGSLTTHTIESEALAQTRTIVVYAPVAETESARPVVYFQDGSDYLNLIDTADLLDRLIANGDIQPLVAVFIPPVNRYVEYDNNDDYVKFLADELTPFVQRMYGAGETAEQTAVLGSDLGGRIALHATLTRPDVFGLAASHSGWLTEEQLQLLTLQEGEATRYHLVVGSYETAIGSNDGQINILELNRQFDQALQRAGIEHRYAEYPEGHSWGLWQAHVGSALRYFFE